MATQNYEPIVLTPAQLARVEAESAELARYYVRLWSVRLDSADGGSRQTISNPLSGLFGSEVQAREALAKLIAEHPTAFLCESVRFFHKHRPEDMEERADLLRQMGLPTEPLPLENTSAVKMEKTANRAFSRTDYVLCTQRECHMWMDDACYFAQSANGAIEIVIRGDATEDDLQGMHERFGVPMNEMKMFRDRQQN